MVRLAQEGAAAQYYDRTHWAVDALSNPQGLGEKGPRWRDAVQHVEP